MTKLNFILTLNDKLSSLPKKDIEERLEFYSEMIEDRIEEGLSEEDAVAAVGNVDKIASQILQEYKSATKPPINKKSDKRRIKAWEIVLIVLGSPLWLSLIIGAFSVIFSLWITLWVVIISLWAVFASLIGTAIGGIAAGIIFTLTGKGFAGATVIGAAMICAGLSIFAFFGCKLATKGAALLTKSCAKTIKRIFSKKEKL